MRTETVLTGLPWNRSIVKLEDNLGSTRYRVKQGKQYIGKTKDGGYTSLESAKAAATRTL